MKGAVETMVRQRKKKEGGGEREENGGGRSEIELRWLFGCGFVVVLAVVVVEISGGRSPAAAVGWKIAGHRFQQTSGGAAERRKGKENVWQWCLELWCFNRWRGAVIFPLAVKRDGQIEEKNGEKGNCEMQK